MGTKQNSTQSRRADKRRKRLYLKLLELDERIHELEIKKIEKIKRYVLMKSLAA